VSPYPDARDFAFTIVHDADDAYSMRLAPLFEVFDRYGLKLTVTAFAFWADGAQKEAWNAQDPILGPKAVPLEDRRELEFYKGLAARGHEIGLHTPSDGHDARERVIEAFEYFQSEFGFYPPVYVEHRDNLENQQGQGGDPDSPFFITDILNRYRPWVWTVSPSALPYNGSGRYFDLLSIQRPLLGWFVARQWGILKAFLKTGIWSSANGQLFETMLRGGTPFDHYARDKFGLCKAFRRSGRREHADGHGFLQWYSDEKLDALERHNGLALVYTHLNTKWLDKQTGRMRDDLEERIAAIGSRNVWLATASNILDRFERIGSVCLAPQGAWLKVANGSGHLIEGLTLISPRGEGLCRGDDVLARNPRNKIVVGNIAPNETLVFRVID
jgi:hypothetical protein